jgi:hypothetical protein
MQQRAALIETRALMGTPLTLSAWLQLTQPEQGRDQQKRVRVTLLTHTPVSAANEEFVRILRAVQHPS